MLIQILLVIFFLFVVVKVFARYRNGDLRLSGLLFWIGFWMLATVIVVWPNSTMQLAKILGVGRGVDAIMYFALALLFFVFFRTTVKIEQLNRDITKLTRKITLLESERNNKDQN